MIHQSSFRAHYTPSRGQKLVVDVARGKKTPRSGLDQMRGHLRKGMCRSSDGGVVGGIVRAVVGSSSCSVLACLLGLNRNPLNSTFAVFHLALVFRGLQQLIRQGRGELKPLFFQGFRARSPKNGKSRAQSRRRNLGYDRASIPPGAARRQDRTMRLIRFQEVCARPAEASCSHLLVSDSPRPCRNFLGSVLETGSRSSRCDAFTRGQLPEGTLGSASYSSKASSLGLP